MNVLSETDNAELPASKSIHGYVNRQVIEPITPSTR